MAAVTAGQTFGLVAPVRAPVNKWLVTVSVTFGTLMGAIDASIVNVAIPHIRGAVGATVEETHESFPSLSLDTIRRIRAYGHSHKPQLQR